MGILKIGHGGIAPVCASILVLALAGCGQESPDQLVAKGKAALESRDARTALIHFKAALQAQPDTVATRVLLGRALAQAGDPHGAIVELTRALEQKAEPSDVLPTLAAAMVSSSQSKRLIDTYGNLTLANKTADATLKTILAGAHAALGNMPKAAAVLAQALATDPDHPAAHVLQARFLLDQRQFDRALAEAEVALRLNGKLPAAWVLKGEVLQLRDNDRAAAQAAFRKALEFDPAFPPAHTQLVTSLIRGGDVDGGRKQLADFVAAAPNNPDAVFLKAQLLYLDKDYAKARELVQQLLKVAGDNPNLLQLAAAVEWQGGSLPIAQKMLETAVRVDPSLVQARINLAYICNMLGQPTRSLAALEPLLKGSVPNGSALAAAGEASLKLGDPAAAEGYFRRAAQATPEDERVQAALAMSQLAQGNSEVGLGALKALVPNSKDGFADSALASAMLARADFDGAAAAVDGLLSKRPDDFAAHELRGRVLVAQRDELGARKAFERALALEPRSITAVVALVELDIRAGNLDAARARADQLIKANPQNHRAVVALAGLRLAAGAQMSDVEASLREVIKAVPDESEPRVKLVDLLISRKKNQTALAVAQEAAAALPNDTQVIDALGRALWADGNTQQALAAFRRMLSIDPNLAVAHTRMAGLYIAEGSRSAAMASLRRAVETDPRQRGPRLQLATMLVDAKRSKEALEIAADLQKREPRAAAGYLLEGSIHRKMLNHDAAAAAYGRGMQQARDPEDLPLNLFASLLAANKWKQAETFALQWLAKHPKEGGLHYHLGEGYLMNRNFAAAEAQFARAVALRPDHVPSLNNLASMRLQQGKSGALEPAETAAKLAPTDPAVLDTLASALAAEGRLPQALESQRKAVAAAPADPGLRLSLAKLALKAGDKALAKAELDRVIAIGGRNPFRDEAGKLRQGL